MKTPKINIHLYQSPFQHESRILRITKTLADNNFFDKIFIIATHLKGLQEIEEIDKTRTIYRIKTIISPSLGSVLRFLFLIEWSFRIFLRFKKENVIAINPHSVPTLPIAYFFKKKVGSKIIFDTHEIETEQYHPKTIRKKISKFIETKYISGIDYLVATSDGYGEWYRKTYGIDRISIVKNYSKKRDFTKDLNSSVLLDTIGVASNEILFIYQGILAPGRGIEMLLEIFKEIETFKHIIFMGFGPLEEIVKDYTKNFKNIHFHPAVKPEEVFRYVQSCDVGLCIIENVYLSYYYTLPNKMLECLNVGVPVIVSNFPDMSASINQFDCGWTTEPVIDSIRNTILSINKEEIISKRSGAFLWAEVNTWESQELILNKVYTELFS